MLQIQPNQTQRVLIPNLSGGINPGSVGEAVSDAQLIDCKNVWFKGGEVITRPKLDTKSQFNINLDIQTVQKAETYIDGKKALLLIDIDYNAILMSVDGEILKEKTSLINPRYSKADPKNYIGFMLYTAPSTDEFSTNCFLIAPATSATAYLYSIYEIKYSNGNLTATENTVEDGIYIPLTTINLRGNLYNKLPRDDEAELPQATTAEGYNLLSGAYKSTFCTDGISHRFTLPKTPVEGKIKVTVQVAGMTSGKNRLTWKGNTLGDGGLSSGFFKFDNNGNRIEVTQLEFANIKSDENGKITFTENYYCNGTFSYWINSGAEKRDYTYYRVKIGCVIDRNTGEISFPILPEDKPIYKKTAEKGNTVDKFDGDLEYTEAVTKADTLDLTASTMVFYQNYDFEDESKNSYIQSDPSTTGGYKIPKFFATKDEGWEFKFSRGMDNNIEATVYGESLRLYEIIKRKIHTMYTGTMGIETGNRGFIAGFDNKVLFTDINRPMYFPENCYFSLGKNNEKITAFGQQSGYLVIFKENSIYCLYETSGTDIKINEQVLVDVTQDYNYHIFSINAEVGCDLPDTVQLCLNKLIFANSDGNIYTIAGLSYNSERNVFCISGLIKDRLKKYTKAEYQKAFALDYSGYYMFFIDDMGFCLDYNRNAYKYTGSYTSDSTVRKYGLFSWWIWQFPKYLKYGISNDYNISLILSSEVETEEAETEKMEYCTLLDSPETETESFIVSKFFDFSAPDFYKGITNLKLEVGNDYDTRLYIELLTDAGDNRHSPIEIYKQADRGTAKYSTELNVRSAVKLCRKFGFKLSAVNGPLAISSVIINYQLKGRI